MIAWSIEVAAWLLVVVAVVLAVRWFVLEDRGSMPPATEREIRNADRDRKPDIAPAIARSRRPRPISARWN